MISTNAPIRGHADPVTLTAAPPRRVSQPIEVDEPRTFFGLPPLVFIAVLGVALMVIGCAIVVGVKAAAR